MGTSINEPSPRIPRWRPALAVLGSDAPADRQSMEVWIAATRDRDGRLGADLGADAVGRAAAIADAANTAQEAHIAFEGMRQDTRASGLNVDFARRALMRACSHGGGSAQFARELFADVAGYYASRDLPSFVGSPGRVPTVSSSIALKQALAEVARAAVDESLERASPSANWRTLVEETLTVLTRLPRPQ